MRLLAGTSGYSFKEWKGSFYPADLKSDQLLSFYATKFPTLEINNSFYQLPKEHILLEWASQVPEQFTFSLKASRRITHFTRLKAESESLVGFLLKNTSVLGDRLGPILFQLPPNLKKDIERLKTFLGYLPLDRRYAFEFRHESWFDDETFSVMRDRDIALCVSESAELACPVVSTATWGYLRLHKLDYSTSELESWAKCVGSQAWNEAYVYFKHDEGAGSGPPAVEAFVRAGEERSSVVIEIS